MGVQIPPPALRSPIEYALNPKIGPVPAVTYVLWTIDGTDVYMISTAPLTPGPPQPAQSSLTLKLIARVRALR